ncbi:MAG: succinate dehydrogenase, cytochrome b556 subunit [Candidatus Eisenbacteria sp.]|nr:succinate dehydrogenase, cytochrome b556 subunit [Candidatus Eisenbacteria bacterium]
MMYRWHAGYVAWLMNRISGVLITFYLVLHIWVIHHLSHGPETYKKVMDILSSKIFMFFELALIGVVLYHMMNGIRIILVDFGNAVWSHKTVFWVLMAIGIVLYVICVWELAGGFLGLIHHEASAMQIAP